IGENECASAKGGFGIAWRKAGLPNGRRLLIARRPANFYGAAEKFRSGFTNRSGGIDDFRHGRSRYSKERQQFAIPSRRIEWHQHGAACIARVCAMQAAGPPINTIEFPLPQG